jgi:hypothetical protein
LNWYGLRPPEAETVNVMAVPAGCGLVRLLERPVIVGRVDDDGAGADAGAGAGVDAVAVTTNPTDALTLLTSAFVVESRSHTPIRYPLPLPGAVGVQV